MIKNRLINEEWKAFHLNDCDHSIEAFYVSNYGRVIRKKPKQVEYRITAYVKAAKFKMFYFKKKGNKHASFYVHRAVAILFIDNPNDNKFVIHIDHNPTNNEAENLKWVNRAELSTHQLLNPTRKKNCNAKLNEGKVRLIKRKLFNPNNKTRRKTIAKQFGISTMQLYRIQTGENWGHVTDY